MHQLPETNTQNGLTQQEAQQLLTNCGPNTLQISKQKNLWDYLLAAFKDITILILIVAACISTYIAYVNHPTNYTEPLVILGIIILNICLSIREQRKAEKSVAALQEYNVVTAKVLRDRIIQEINAEELVPGDILQLETGDRIPADAKIIEAINLLVDESLLTGESEPVTKSSCSSTDDADASSNTIFSGTLVIEGKCKALITRTGMTTEIGKISSLLNEGKTELAPLQLRMQKLGRTLSIVAMGAALLALLIGWLQGNPLDSILMVAISVAVAAIPEVLPVVVNISLSYGINNMAKQNTIVRTPVAVETIGNVSVICSDKTGTLTQNKMQVKKIWEIHERPKSTDDTFTSNDEHLLEMMYLASNIELANCMGIGNPTEIAIIRLAKEKIKTIAELQTTYEPCFEIPFDSTRKRMTKVYKINDRFITITKGAFDRLPIKRNSEIIIKADEIHDQFAKEALRVIGVAYKYYDELPNNLTEEELETDLTFSGFVGIIDPPKEKTYQAVKTAAAAGIKTVMITGDHVKTAETIAQNIGILNNHYKVMDGKTLNKLTDEQLEDIIEEYTVFARTSPEDKIRIVKALQNKENVVAMTGDGVNDAPALKAADVGIAMGSGTDVAKDSADMILLDDNYATIVTAVKEGRRVYSNIRKSLYAMLGCNISAILIVLLSLIFGWGAPVTALQLLIIKVVADGIPGFSLCVEKAEPHIMERPPVKKGSSIFIGGLWNKIFIISIVFTIATLIPIAIGNYTDFGSQNPLLIQAMTFVVLGLTTIGHMYNCRSSLSAFKIGFTGNKVLLGTTLLGTILLIAMTAIPPIASILGLTAITWQGWLLVIFLSLIPFLFVEVQKALNKFGEI